jgi:hypothetical protein
MAHIFLKPLLTNVLSDYVENGNQYDLNLRFLATRPVVELENLRLKPDAVAGMALGGVEATPLKVTSATIGKVKITIPVTRLQSACVRVEVHDFRVEVRARRRRDDWSGELLREEMATTIRDKYQAYWDDLVRGSKGESKATLKTVAQYFDPTRIVNRGIIRILDNMKFEMTNFNVNMTWEEEEEEEINGGGERSKQQKSAEDGVRWGIESVAVYTADPETGAESFDDTMSYRLTKIADFRGFEISPFFARIESFRVRAAINTTLETGPSDAGGRADLQIHLDDRNELGIHLNDANIRLLVNLKAVMASHAGWKASELRRLARRTRFTLVDRASLSDSLSRYLDYCLVLRRGSQPTTTATSSSNPTAPRASPLVMKARGGSLLFLPRPPLPPSR